MDAPSWRAWLLDKLIASSGEAWSWWCTPPGGDALLGALTRRAHSVSVCTAACWAAALGVADYRSRRCVRWCDGGDAQAHVALEVADTLSVAAADSG